MKPFGLSSKSMLNCRPFLMLALVIACLHPAAAWAGPGRQTTDAPAEAKVDLEKQWGIRPVMLLLSSGGYMLDFRYHVTDADKAAPLFSRQIKPYLIDEASGAKFFVPETPKVGALRQTRRPVAGKNYFIIFGNPAKYVKRGSKVTVMLGDAKIEHLVVQ